MKILLALLAATSVCSAYYHNGSYDMGIHYALVFHAFEPDCVAIGAMCGYPPASHRFAAIIGLLFQSPFLGMILLSSASIFAIYASLFWLMRFSDKSATSMALTMLCVVCVLGSARRLPLIGLEVRGNFFFAQLVGTAAVFVFTSFNSRRLPPLLSLATVFLLGWVYPISAIQLAGATITSMLLSRAALWQVALLSVGAAGAIVLHPLFQGSAINANNDGAIATGWITANLTIWFAFALAAVAIYLASVRFNTVFVSLAAGVAGAAIAQWVALRFFTMGSPYIVAKHIFAVFTMLVAGLALVLATKFREGWRLPVFSWQLPAAALICTIAVIPPQDSSTLAFIRAERGIGNLKDPRDLFALDVGPRGKSIAEALQRLAP